ncbi:MAG: phospholipid carrier-dependent glycosyltransferase [Patescibacteria group bacterium]
MKWWVPLVILLGLSAVLHLWRLGVPRQVIFDEVHFGKFVTAYCCTHQRFFDIHPPHAKLLIAGTAKLIGYQGGFNFDHIGEEYGDISPIPLRLFPAIAGILLPLIFYALLRLLKVSPLISFFGGLAVVLDNASLVQTRIIALDGLLLTATFGSLAAYLAGARSQGTSAWLWYIVAGVLAGLAAGTKFTGLAALVLLGVLVLQRVLSQIKKGATRPLLSGLVILVSAFVVYIAGWAVHFALLTQPGEGDAWGVPTGNFWQDTVTLHRTMLSANYNLTATHPDESPWWSWPVMLTSIFYWNGDGGEVIYFLGNPAVWWGSTLLFLWAFFLGRREVWKRGWVPFLGFLIAMLPLVRVPRALFLYHYLTPLLFSLAFGLVWLDTVLVSPERRRKVLGAATLALVVFFLAFAPLTFGLSVAPGWISALYWLPNWR